MKKLGKLSKKLILRRETVAPMELGTARGGGSADFSICATSGDGPTAWCPSVHCSEQCTRPVTCGQTCAPDNTLTGYSDIGGC